VESNHLTINEKKDKHFKNFTYSKESALYAVTDNEQDLSAIDDVTEDDGYQSQLPNDDD